MAQVACDRRFPADQAERAAVRFGAAVRKKAFLSSLTQPDEQSALRAWSSTLQTEQPHLANKLLEEEAGRHQVPSQPGQAAQSQSVAPRASKSCLLFCLGLSNRPRCQFEHQCPFNPACGPQGGCLLSTNRNGHLHTLRRREVRYRIMPYNSSQGRRRSRSPPRRQAPPGQSQQAPPGQPQGRQF